MFSYLYEWIMNLSYYMVMVTAVMHIVPNSDYKRYIRFFTGLVLVLMLTDPVLGLLGAGDLWQNLYESPAYREQVEKMEQALQDFTGMSEDFEEESKERDQEDFAGSMGSAGTEEDAGTQIRVDEIKIGR
ncbi:stage III sporulation protein AF [Lachnospiraceae bacterium 48-21]|nr:stage III sporulation protein AF [Dorea sp.]